jgi:hypothetical protein
MKKVVRETLHRVLLGQLCTHRIVLFLSFRQRIREEDSMTILCSYPRGCGDKQTMKRDIK